MNFKHTPHPVVEDHYHIQELINAQEKRANDRTYHRDRAKAQAERMDEIKAAQAKVLKPFWCSTCAKDFAAEAIKEVERDWSNPTQYIAFYRTVHWCGTRCLRLITDVHRDAYWYKSKMVAIDKGKHYTDTLQPHETGFNIMYKKI